MQLSISGDKNIDREILFKLPLEDILNVRQINSYLRDIVCNEHFLKTQLNKVSETLLEYKSDEQTWSEYFVLQTLYIFNLKTDYFYTYKFGNPKNQYMLFHKYFQTQYFLNKAAKYGELAIVQEAIRLGYDVLEGDSKARIALSEAAKYKHFHIVKYLIENFNHEQWDIDLALRFAGSSGHFDMLKYLIKKGANVNAANGAIIFWTAINNNLEMLKYLVEEHNTIIDSQDDILTWLCKQPSNDKLFDTIVYLVERGVDISLNHYNAFRTALEYGNLKIANYLSTLMRNE